MLKPGVKLIGKLDESVARPVKNGFVEICVVEATDHRIPRSTKPRNEKYDQTGFKWNQTVPLKEDGSFVVESLPAGGHVQLFALTDGYQSQIPTIDELAEYLKKHDAGGEETLEWAEEEPFVRNCFLSQMRTEMASSMSPFLAHQPRPLSSRSSHQKTSRSQARN